MAFPNRVLVGGDLVERLYHHCLRLDWGTVPPPRLLGVAPEHPQLLVGDAVFKNRLYHIERHLLVAQAVQRERDVRLRLAIADLHPMLLCLFNEVVKRLFVCLANGTIFQIKTPAIEVECDGRVEVIVIERLVLDDAFVAFLDPVIESAKRLDRLVDRHALYAQMAQTSKACGDIQGNVITGAATGEPWPTAVVVLSAAKLLE